MLVAGEASGDRYAAQLTEELRRRHPSWTFCGMGGDASRQAQIDLLVDSTRLAVVGLVEVLRHYREIRRAFRTLKQHLRTQPPDLLVLIDYPEFNMRLARYAHRRGIKTLFYISPQIWAWRPWRVRAIRHHIDCMAVILPFEQKFYQDRGVAVRYVGHPLSGQVRPTQDPDTVRARWKLDAQRPVIGLFPGSRHSELEHLMPVCIGAVEQLRTHASRPQFVLPVAPGMTEADYAPWLASDTPVICMKESVYDAMQVCDMAMAASGTVTLQLALMRVPFCMMYRMAKLTHLIARRLVRIDRYCLPNIIAGETLAEELIQDHATPQRVATTLTPWLDNPNELQEIRSRLGVVQDRLGPATGIASLADCADELLGATKK